MMTDAVKRISDNLPALLTDRASFGYKAKPEYDPFI
jgi:hypothetical protein